MNGRYIISLIVLLIPVLFAGCSKDDPETVNKGEIDLTGNWVNPIYIDSLITYEKAGALIENQYGIAFGADNKLVERKNSGWCGTPPIVTADYDGSWQMNDSIIDVSVAYWGGTAVYKWKLVSISENTLVVSTISNSFLEGK